MLEIIYYMMFFLHLFEGVDNNEPTYTLWICQDSTFQDAMHGLLGFRIFGFKLGRRV